MEKLDIMRAFHGLYGGGDAQVRREAGDLTAMPPWNETYWMGKQVVKCPNDLWTYQEIIYETSPDLIVECGTSGGGSAYYFAKLMDLIGHGHILTIDKDNYPHLRVDHPRITYITGDTLDPAVIEQVRVTQVNLRVMVSLDSLHTYEHVKAELAAYAMFTTPELYCVVEDTGFDDQPDWCSRAVAEFLGSHPQFLPDLSREKHLFTSNRNGWLKRMVY